MNFLVTVPVKPYVKRFLEINYGMPVDFRKHPRENDMFKGMLKKPNYEDEQKYKNELSLHSHTVEVTISDRDFYRHGWELSKTDTIAFGKYFERRAKMQMRSSVGMYVSFGWPINKAIMRFQRVYGYEEEYWPFDSIKKDVYRFYSENEIDLNDFAYQHLERLIMVNMEQAGVITGNVIKMHERRMVESE